MTEVQYIEKLQEMIATEGWRLLVKECTDEIHHLQCDALEAPNWEKVNQMRGRATQLAELINLEDMLATQLADLSTQEIVDDADISV
jgi:hypothetical protein